MSSCFPYQLYLVISEAACGSKSFLTVAEQAIIGGVDIIQLREKNIPNQVYLDRAQKLKEITDKYAVPLIINDNLSVAKQVQAHGIHVGNNDMQPFQIRNEWDKTKIVGYSIEYLEQLNNNETIVSNYLGVSPVFQTTTKTDTVTEWGLEGIRKIRSLTTKPLVAIGNMNLGNAASVIQAGANCIAVVSAICSANNPEKAAFALKQAIINA